MTLDTPKNQLTKYEFGQALRMIHSVPLIRIHLGFYIITSKKYGFFDGPIRYTQVVAVALNKTRYKITRVG